MSSRTVGLYGLIVLVTLVAAELLARAYDWSPRFKSGAAGDGLGEWRYFHAPGGFGDLVPGQDGHWVIWFHRPYHVQTNSVGLRNAEEPAAPAMRILAVGDSQTFGPYLANEDTWPAWTENYLRQRLGGADKAQVFNAGIAGYTIVDELAYLREKGTAFRPALVVLAVFENDIDDLRKEKDGRVQRPAGGSASRVETALKALGRSSALVTLAEEIKSEVQRAAAGVDIRRGEGAVQAPDMRPERDRFVRRYGDLFRETVALLKERNIPLAVIFIPAADALEGRSATEPVVKALTAETGTPYLDLTLAFRLQPDAATRLYLLQNDVGSGGLVGNGHLSREGNAVIGRAVADWLLQQALLPRAAENARSP
jgi:lysophospholipase L1-like esterase